jgi:hypothetical protein
MRRLRLAFVAFALPLTALLCASRVAHADRVAVLPFTSIGNATSVDLDKARAATQGALGQMGHKLPTSSEMLTAEMAFKGEHGGDSKAYQSAGRASSAEWAVGGHVEAHGATYRLELEACKVDTGRVESLAREIDPPKAPSQIQEMFALLLRPEGIANADIPWQRATPPVFTPKPDATEKKDETKVVTKAPPPDTGPPPPPPVKHAYAEDHPIAVGIMTSVLTAAQRDSKAQGSATSVHVGGSFGYALSAVPGLELRGDAAGAVAGPQSISAIVGARYMLGALPTKRIFVGPELGVGTFVTLGAEKTARFLAHGSVVGAVGLGEHVQLELAGDVDYAAGGASGLLLVGGTARGSYRF